jgi:hypothetical protein
MALYEDASWWTWMWAYHEFVGSIMTALECMYYMSLRALTMLMLADNPIAMEVRIWPEPLESSRWRS